MTAGVGNNIFNKLISVFFIFLVSQLAAFAMNENSISAIDVQQTKDGSYNIMLKLDKNAAVNKIKEGQDSLTLVVNSTLPSDSMEIVYDNASDLQNVIVQKKNDENTLIFLQGKNINNAQIYTKELSTGIVKKIDTKTGGFFIADKKIFGYSLALAAAFFLFMLVSRPSNKRYKTNSEMKPVVVKRQKRQSGTIRNKSLVRSKSAPSINYAVNGRFVNSKKLMTVPDELIYDGYDDNSEENEKIRKAG